LAGFGAGLTFGAGGAGGAAVTAGVTSFGGAAVTAAVVIGATLAAATGAGASLFGNQPAKLAITTPLAMVTAVAATRISGCVVLAAAVGTVWMVFKVCLRNK
jgi:hypothetical protein